MGELFVSVAAKLSDYQLKGEPSVGCQKPGVLAGVLFLIKRGCFSASTFVGRTFIYSADFGRYLIFHQNQHLPSIGIISKLSLAPITEFTYRCVYRSLRAAGVESQIPCSVSNPYPAVVIPSGEGKSTLCRNHPELFLDLDEEIVKAFNYTTDYGGPDGQIRILDYPDGYYFPGLPSFRKKFEAHINSEENKKKVLLTTGIETGGRTVYRAYALPQPTGIRFNYPTRAVLSVFYKEQLRVVCPTERDRALIAFARNYNSHFTLRRFWSSERLRAVLSALA
ncbi:hypothetical protein [Hubei virga-like virus 16]|uniref:hypothetical protein n=1 Tax=Hubei virga-like virus 16 TaxID=1923331 RepID=UPI00090B205D|nr:hypothetical protein [Hubei virga-like virus 16]APG77523.1 hypothetical protein [Hubei virga-like virus 16]